MITILYGDEPYGILKRKHKVVSQVTIPSMNLIELSGQFDLDVKNSCETFPFAEEKRVVVLDIDSLKALETKEFEEYLTSPCSTTDLVVVSKAVDQRTKLFKRLKALEVLSPCMKLDENTLKKVILSELASKDARIQTVALAEFIKRMNYAGNKDMNLLQMMGYLNTMVEVNKDITLDMVVKFSPKFEEPNIFILTGLIKSGNSEELYRQISMVSPKDAIGTLSLLFKDFRVSYKLKYFGKEEVGDSRCSFSDYDTSTLVECMELLNEVIEGIKTGRIAGEQALKLACGKLLTILN